MKTIPAPAPTTRGLDPARDAYERTAPYYDQFTAHHDYELWLASLLSELRRFGLAEPGSLLDVGCGTAKSFLPMLARGWSVTGVDISSAMLERARSKAGDRARLVERDMRELGRLGDFELVWCLDDALNYLACERELATTLGGLARNLAAGGLCLFDLNTLASYRGFFASTLTVDCGSVELTWRGRASAAVKPGGRASALLEVRDRRGRLIERARHRQRHFSRSQVSAALSGAGLELLGVYGHGEDAVLCQPLDESSHTKAIYIARLRPRR